MIPYCAPFLKIIQTHERMVMQSQHHGESQAKRCRREKLQAIPCVPSQQRETAAWSDKAGERLTEPLGMFYYHIIAPQALIFDGQRKTTELNAQGKTCKKGKQVVTCKICGHLIYAEKAGKQDMTGTEYCLEQHLKNAEEVCS